MVTYIGLLRKDPDSDFGVDFPDFPGCITAGSTLEETRQMAGEALTGHIACMVDLGQSLPPPSRLEAVMANPENAEAIPFPVSVPDRLTGTSQVALHLPAGEIEQLTALADKRGTTPEALLAEAARRLLAAEEEHQPA